MLAALTATGCGAAPAAVSGLGAAGSPAAAPEPTLVDTYWQLTSYRERSAAGSVPVVGIDSTLSLTANGNVAVHACNFMGGTARMGPATLTVTLGVSTAIGCSGADGEIERQVEAMFDSRTVRWSIRDRVLTLSGQEGQVLTYRVRPSPYPDLDARTVAVGKLAGGEWRLAAGRAGGLYMTFETRTKGDAGWGRSMIRAPGPGDCLASSVMEGGVLGGRHYVAAWATPEVGKVTVRATPASPEQSLPLHAVPDSSLRIAGAWLDDFRPSASTVTFYDRAGAVISAYPNGPCR